MFPLTLLTGFVFALTFKKVNFFLTFAIALKSELFTVIGFILLPVLDRESWQGVAFKVPSLEVKEKQANVLNFQILKKAPQFKTF